MKYLRRLSLKLRLTLLFVLIFTGSLAAFSYFLYQDRLENRLAEFDANLYNYAIDIAESLDIDSYGVVEFDPGIIKLNEKIFPFSLGKSFISVLDVNGKVVAHSQNLVVSEFSKIDERVFYKVLKKGVGYSRLIASDGKKFRIIYYLLPVLKIDSPLILQIVVPYSSVELGNAKLKRFLITSLGIILFSSCFIGYAFMSRALRPMIEITNKTKQIEVKNLNESVPVPESRDEISELAQTINHLLQRLHKSFEAQERFVQDASHQLKTPLAIMKGELEIFKATNQKSELEINNFLDSMSQELNSLVKLTNDLLILARVENDGSHLTIGIHQIDEILLTQVSRLSKLAMGKNIVINIDLDGLESFDSEITSVYVDPDLIGILFYNFIENAIKYSAQNSIIEIKGFIEANDITISIRDSGPGIKEGQEDKIFDRFYRSENANGYQGSGLGLAICKAVAKLHQAEIWGSRNLDKGSTFFFRIKNIRGRNEIV